MVTDEKTNTLQSDLGISNYYTDEEREQERLNEEEEKRINLERKKNNYRLQKLFNSLDEDVRQKYLKIVNEDPELKDWQKKYPDYIVANLAEKDGYSVEVSAKEYAAVEEEFEREYQEENS